MSCIPGPENRSAHAVSSPLRASALKTLGAVFAAAIAVFAYAGLHPGLGLAAPAAAAAALFCIYALVLGGLRHHPHPKLGAANLVTAIRAAMVCLAGATVLLADNIASSNQLLWGLAALTSAALLLDGVDGYLARRNGEASDLGARFDMETDALLILILSAAAFILGKAGLWVLGIGLMRYAFVLAQVALPRLRGSLSPSFRRQLICVVQVGALCLLLLPFIVPPVSTLIAAGALSLLAYSFAVDLRALWVGEA
ncbi:CDP-alcohol phosphatidyltransferase family protein [Roseibium litorale]|uniref:CDP-alcohol phosphatidyltransferase family protein n=1 Tax=Roseibium litorale TaxID=2803841 RepID=A0ABR9CLP7_9HYPH|nr:CDP-alcohol phosphatidyltransferase family protein [Roseibium litorale]MBD8891236.1 CDP-alcohol phosphatidyltransferase family protein [Roseibium litorale]